MTIPVRWVDAFFPRIQATGFYGFPVISGLEFYRCSGS